MDYKLLLDELKGIIPRNRIYTDELRRLAYGTDASFYRLIPEIIIKIKNETEAAAVIRKCGDLKIPVTFRAAGTSLSGQAITDSVLLMIDRDWKGYKISNDADFISLEPAVIGAWANLYLKPFNKKIGPDPASINSAMIGGIAANNASGMCCGTAQNSYNTMHSMKIIFSDGTILDTGNEQSIKEFKEKKSGLIQSLLALKDKVTSDGELKHLISAKYKMKNTTGYSINALVDFDDPADIIQHLMIGSEGTLGFISEITYRTVPEYKNKASALVIFDNIKDACAAVVKLKSMPVDAVEIMDRASLRSVEDKKGMPGYLKELGVKASALLIETSAEDEAGLFKNVEQIRNELEKFNLLKDLEFTSELNEYAKLWNIRKGLFPSVGAMRNAGTTVVIEDVCFPVIRLAEAVGDLQKLFAKYNYDEAIIFGHALEGNLHFVFNQDFNSAEEVERYKNFMKEVVETTAGKYRGSLKAEHGTGRNMAPFVKYEWGETAYEIMKEIKNIFDPGNILNPSVIISSDESAHIKNLKPTPAAHEIIDKCIECGFCENVCPSKDLTLTPRQRIVILREISRGGASAERLLELSKQFEYDGADTCATDGLCKLKCPVEIDTGKMIKSIRRKNNSKFSKAAAGFISVYFSTVISAVKTGLSVVDFLRGYSLGNKLKNGSGFLRRIMNNKFPLILDHLPRTNISSSSFVNLSSSENKVVYFPSCINRAMGADPHEKNGEPLTVVMQRLLNKAGYEAVIPKGLSGLCCGMPFASKGFDVQAEEKAAQLTNALLKASDNGSFPVLFDMSPCTKTEKDFVSDAGTQLRIYDSIEFIADFVLPKLKLNKTDKTVALFNVCSAEHMGLKEKLIFIAEACVENVILPNDISCCGFAGDRGFMFPELNESALHNLKTHIPKNCSEGYSSSRTCEIGLSEYSGINYKSIVYLVDEASNHS